MKKLITDPSKILLNQNDENVFLQKCFLNYIDKRILDKINYSIFSKTEFELSSEIKTFNEDEVIYREILKDLFPILNVSNKVNWNYKTWNFFLGFWLRNFVSIVRNRINLVKPLLNSDINFEEQIKIGKNASLLSNDLRDFTLKAGTVEWNEKLFSRILYILQTKNFDNDASFLNSKINIFETKETIFNKTFYNLKISLIKFFERLVCSKNKYLFYNTYIKSGFTLFKIISKLGDIPFIYSFPFFNNKIVKEKINIYLRKKIKTNLESNDLNFKILKSLLVELLPTIYLEGFEQQRKLATNSHLPKEIKKIFISQAYPDNSFKFWLADQINNGAKIAHGQHGAGYNIYKSFFGYNQELKYSEKFFTWGWKDNNNETISIGNYLINKNNKKPKSLQNEKKILLVLPAVNIFKRDSNIFYADSLSEDILTFQKFIDNLNPNLLSYTSVRNHPAIARRELDFLKFINIDKKVKILGTNNSFDKSIINQDITIFNYISTEFLKLISLNLPCMLLLNKNILNLLVTDKSRDDFNKLSDIGIFHTSGESLAMKVNKISNDIENWWCNEKSIKIRNEFCNKHSDPNFNIKLFINHLNQL